MRRDSSVFYVLTALIMGLAACSKNVEIASRPGPAQPQAASGGGGNSPSPTVVDDNPSNVVSAGASGSAAGSPGSMTPIVPPKGTLPKFQRDDTARSKLPSDVIEKLRSGTGPCSGGIAYPNEGTMFPGGLLPPTLMWPVPAGQPQTGAYLHASYQGDAALVDYQFAVDGSKPGELQIPADAWQEITARTDETKLNLELKISFGSAVQACTTHWRVARGNITGSLFYYKSATNFGDALGMTVPGTGPMQQGIFRLRLGAATSEPFMVADAGLACIGCHSMNARGTRISALNSTGNVLTFTPMITYDVYDVSSGKPNKLGQVDNSVLGAMTPDGKFMLTLGAPDCTAGEPVDVPPNRNPWYVEGPAIAKLVDMDTGKDVASHGLNPDYYMWMPQFSPDGTKVVFNHAKPDPNRPGFTDRRELAIMDYDRATQTFSNLKVIVSRLGPSPARDYTGGSFAPIGMHYASPGRAGCMAPAAQISAAGMYTMGVCDEPCYPAWPAFTPDNKGVIFSLLDQPDFNHAIGRKVAAKAHLYYTDLRSGQVIRLENAMRVSDAAEYGRDNYTTMLPVSAGGYGWIFWTGRRSWGTRGGGLFSPDPGQTVMPDAAGNPNARKIWVSAIRLSTTDNQAPIDDPSFPAFFLEGQGERPSMRTFAALNACSVDGKACGGGVDCCSGFCTQGVCGAPAVPSCSKTMDACKQSADCCQTDTGQACIGGFCDVIVLN